DEAIKTLNNQPGNNIRAIVLLSDGDNTVNGKSLGQVLDAIRATWQTPNPVIVIPIAYGSGANMGTLTQIATASFIARVQQAAVSVNPGVDEAEIARVLREIITYF
ncbi:MAG: hypothetical protein K8I30_19735, partial [Anaerolineae bacterium]|nr:hypothetical protein [Anaerolineae bacterium]